MNLTILYSEDIIPKCCKCRRYLKGVSVIQNFTYWSCTRLPSMDQVSELYPNSVPSKKSTERLQ